MKLNHYIAQSGIASRRKAAELVKAGKVKVNGTVIKEPGYDVKPDDRIVIYGKQIKPVAQKIYILLNKPAGCVTTVSDEKGRKTVIDVLGKHIKQRIYPVGRLDYNTTGLLLLTNDGDLAHKLAHPRSEIKKVYHVVLNRSVPASVLDRIRKGIKLSDGIVHVDHVDYWSDKQKNHIKITLHSGKYRIIKRIFNYLGYMVASLDRVGYAHMTKKGLPRGAWRSLTQKEIEMLKKSVRLKADS